MFLVTVADGKVVDLREVGDGTALSVLDDEMLQNNWYELKLNADGNVKNATLIEVDDATLAKAHTVRQAPQQPPTIRTMTTPTTLATVPSIPSSSVRRRWWTTPSPTTTP